MTDTVDLIVVGAGPAGMAAATSAADLGLTVIIVDQQAEPGGQIYRGLERLLRVRLETLCLITVPCEPPCEESDVGDKNPCLCGGD